MSKNSLNIVVTGGNSGIGFETIKQLYFQGYNIVFGSRNQSKNKEAIATILAEEKQQHTKLHDNFIKSFSLDLSKKRSIEDFAKQVKGVYKHIDVLINNAGLIMQQLSRNQDNIQMTLAANHFGHFYLTYLLFPQLKQSSEARIINVSSQLHYSAPEKFLEDIYHTQKKSFAPFQQYNISKLYNAVFAQELSRRIAKYKNIKTFSLHPGIVDTNFGSDSTIFKVFKVICCCLIVSSTKGARTSVFLTTDNFTNLKSGEYYDSDTKLKEVDKRARDIDNGKELWQTSEKIYKIKFDP